MAAALLLHAAAIAAFALPSSFDAQPASSPPASFTVALMPTPSAEPAPPEPKRSEPRRNTEQAPASPQNRPGMIAAEAAKPAASEPVTERAASEHAVAATGSAHADYAADAAGTTVSAGQPRTGASIPAHYAAGNRKPEYPLLARRLEEQGTVVLRVLVREDGRTGKVIVLQSSGHVLLDESARTAVEKWRFQPASVGNVAIAEWYQLAIPFALYNREPS